jgi:hypothetical protein
VREKAKEENNRIGAVLADALVEMATNYIHEHGRPDKDDFEDIFVS